MITRSFANSFEVSDYTQELITIPNTWGTLQQLGIFQTVPVAENTVIVEKYIKGREFAVGIVGSRVLPAIEIIPKHGFYDYKRFSGKNQLK